MRLSSLGRRRQFRLGPTERIDDGEQRRPEEDSPERNDDTQKDGHEDGSPDGYAGGSLKKPGLEQELIDDNDDGVEAEDKGEALKVLAADKDGHDREDDGDHTSEVGDEGHEAPDEGPHRREGNTKDSEANPPENGDTERLKRNGTPPVQKSSTGGAGMRAEIKRHSGLDAILFFGEAERERTKPIGERK